MRARLTAAALLLALLAGCAAPAAQSDSAPLPTASEPEAPQAQLPSGPSGPFGLAWDPAAGLNPYDCLALSNRTVLSLLYEPLFAVDASFTATPYLCAQMESSGDGRTHTLTLREGVTFSDGTALTAADVAASIRAAQNSDYYGDRLDLISSVTATSDQTLTVTTSAACGSLDALLNIYVVQSGTVGDTAPVGTGPYRLSGETLIRSDWWRGTAPVVDEPSISLTAATTATELRDVFEYGDATLACTDPNIGNYLAYHTDFELWNNNTTVMQYVAFNRNSPVFAYQAIRALVTWAVDRDAIVSSTANGFATAAVLPASPFAAVYDSALAAEYDYDPDAVSAALAAAGISDLSDGDGILDIYTDSGTQSLRGTLVVSGESEQRVAAAQAVVDALNGWGFDLSLRALAYDDYVSALRNGNYDLYYGEVRLSPDFDLGVFFDTDGNLSYGSIADGEAAQLCARARENEGNAYDLYRYVLEQGLLCPILFKTYAIYSDRGSVTGLTPCLDGVFLQPFSDAN